MSRWKAAAIHLSISIMIGLPILALLFLVWYPQPYFQAAGGQHLIIVLLGVHLVLGPVLTLILFKSGKKGMLFDLWTIAILQGTGLVYGLHVIAESRPIFIVAAVDRFNVITPADLDPADLTQGEKPEFRSESWTGPKLVAARLPTDVSERDELLFKSIGGKDLQNYPKYYVSYNEERLNLLKRAKSIESLRKNHPESAGILDRWISNHPSNTRKLAWVPIEAKNASLVMLLDADDGEVIQALPIDPW